MNLNITQSGLVVKHNSASKVSKKVAMTEEMLRGQYHAHGATSFDIFDEGM